MQSARIVHAQLHAEHHYASYRPLPTLQHPISKPQTIDMIPRETTLNKPASFARVPRIAATMPLRNIPAPSSPAQAAARGSAEPARRLPPLAPRQSMRAAAPARRVAATLGHTCMRRSVSICMHDVTLNTVGPRACQAHLRMHAMGKHTAVVCGWQRRVSTRSAVTTHSCMAVRATGQHFAPQQLLQQRERAGRRARQQLTQRHACTLAKAHFVEIGQ
jgi:hypothetical protein